MLRFVLSLLLVLLSAFPPASAHADASAVTTEEWCGAIGKRLRSVPTTLCRSLGLKAAPVQSTKGRALMLRDIQPLARQVAQSSKNQPQVPRVLLIGGIHGDELTSASIVFRWLQWLGEPDSDGGRYHWRVIPVANPDGLLANPPQRTNGRGVDLNRNFPTPDWSRDAHTYWAGKTGRDPRRFPGREALSESETRWLHDEIESFQPDLVVSIHAPFGILDYDGAAQQPERFGHLKLNRLGTYPGSLGNYGSTRKNTPVITIELPHATAMPSPGEQRQIWDDMLKWMRLNVANKTHS